MDKSGGQEEKRIKQNCSIGNINYPIILFTRGKKDGDGRDSRGSWSEITTLALISVSADMLRLFFSHCSLLELSKSVLGTVIDKL